MIYQQKAATNNQQTVSISNSYGSQKREQGTGSFPKGHIINTGCQNPSAFSFVASHH